MHMPAVFILPVLAAAAVAQSGTLALSTTHNNNGNVGGFAYSSGNVCGPRTAADPPTYCPVAQSVTIFNTHAFMCEMCFRLYGTGVGPGKGLKLFAGN